MLRLSHIMKDWSEAGSLPAQVSLYGFWDEHAFVTKAGDLGSVLRIGGADYESLDRSGRDYVAKRVEAAFRSLTDGMRLYQYFFRHNQASIPHAACEAPLVQAAVEQRQAFLEARADRLYSVEMFWVVMVDGSYSKSSLMHALSKFPKSPAKTLKEITALLSGSQQRTLFVRQIERDRQRLAHAVQSLSGQLSDLFEVELLGAETAFRFNRRLVNFCPFKIQHAPLVRMRHLDRQLCDSELEAYRGYLTVDDYYTRVLTLKELPTETWPLLVRGLFDVPANFHVVMEWHPVDNARTRKEIAKRRRHHHNSKTSFLSNLQDRSNTAKPGDELVDDSKEAAVAELGAALTAIGIEGHSFGELTFSIVIYDRERERVERAVVEFQKFFTQHDGLLYEERYNLLNAFFATLPGNRHFNLRKQWALNANLADLSFVFTVGSGQLRNRHLESE